MGAKPQKKYDPELLKEEAKSINSPISLEELVQFFKRKRERTESSPSGLHIGHYKTSVQDEAMANLLLIMINIGLKCGILLQRWQQSINIMIEKEKGNPKLHRLRIIQLFESDFNFLKESFWG